ncbi:MAG: hypothetical protein WBG70_11340 [Spirulinaceae cyanobacterium]
MKKNNRKRTVFPPQPVLASSSRLPANHLISIQLDDHEDVEWIWTSLPDGVDYVSGYKIIEKNQVQTN